MTTSSQCLFTCSGHYKLTTPPKWAVWRPLPLSMHLFMQLNQWTKKARWVDLKPLLMHLNSSELGQRPVVSLLVSIWITTCQQLFFFFLCVHFMFVYLFLRLCPLNANEVGRGLGKTSEVVFTLDFHLCGHLLGCSTPHICFQHKAWSMTWLQSKNK